MHLTPTNRRIFYHLKLNTMVQTDISQLTAECNQWRENLHSHRDDLHHLKHKLQQVAGKPLTKDQLTDLCNDIAIINKGRIVARGTKDEFTAGGKTIEEAYLALVKEKPQP